MEKIGLRRMSMERGMSENSEKFGGAIAYQHDEAMIT